MMKGFMMTLTVMDLGNMIAENFGEEDDNKDEEEIIYWHLETLEFPTIAHETFEDPDTGTMWRVLVPDDGNGNALIITEYVHNLGTRFHYNIGFTLFQSSEIQSVVRNWWNDSTIVGPTLRTRALDYEFQDAAGNAIPRTSTVAGAGIEVDRGNGSANRACQTPNNSNFERGITRPLAEGVGIPEPFILSISEANRYFTGNIGRVTRRSRFASTNARWWLRSGGGINGVGDDAFYLNRHSTVDVNGRISGDWEGSLSLSDRGIRPAVWVRR